MQQERKQQPLGKTLKQVMYIIRGHFFTVLCELLLLISPSEQYLSGNLGKSGKQLRDKAQL